MAETKNQIKILFMGTSVFAETILAALVENNFNIIGVFTQPDKKIGRQQEAIPSAVKVSAQKNNISVHQPEKLDSETISLVKKLSPEIIVVAAYGKIIPQSILDIPKLGCLNIHASLLPKYRGASPIQNALLTGDSETGVTIIKMNEKIDEGDIIAREKISIEDSDNRETLSQKLADLGASLLVKTIPGWKNGQIKAELQDNSKATLCQLIEREDGRIIWEEEAQNIFNKFRAFYPWPGIFAFWKEGASLVRLKLNKISLQKNNPEMRRKIGEVFELGEKVGVQTLEGVIFLEEIQMEGKSSVSVREFLNGHPAFIGSILN